MPLHRPPHSLDNPQLSSSRPGLRSFANLTRALSLPLRINAIPQPGRRTDRDTGDHWDNEDTANSARYHIPRLRLIHYCSPGCGGDSTAMAEPAVTFCVEDTIGLKDDKYMVGVIDRTFGDVDGHEPAPQREYQDPIRKHASVPVAQFQAFMKNGVPPRGACLVSWQTEYATELILESQLELLDRTFYVGDIVSRNAFNPMSGTVIGTRAECTLLPTDAIHNGELSETVQHDTSIRGVPAEELQYIHEYKEDDLVLYNDWVGRIEELHDEVSIRLDNGFVVVVEHAHELEPDDQAVDRLSVGDKVRTKKGNLRRGRWKYGSFNPNLRPHGTIVEVRTIEISVRWLSQSYTFKPDSTTTIPRGREPPIVIGLDILDSGDLRVYDSTKNPPAMTSFEATDPSRVYHMADINVGDRVRFKDIAGASVKYDGTKMYSSELPQGKVVRIPRTETQGYDMNVYLVMQLHTTVKVLWQDLSITEDRSISLIPDPNTDDVDEVWPGEIVATKEKTDEQFEEASWAFKPAKVGVVQTVRAIDRIATVRWFENADIRYTGEDLIYPCRTGKIGTVEEDISLYDIKNVGLTRRRGDFVKIIPESQAEWITPLTDAEMQTLADRLESVPGVRLCHLFGEVIDLGLDGKLTIRLGAADTVMDVRVAPERVNLVHSNDMDSDYFNDGYHSMDEDGDGFDSYDDTDMGDASDFENMWVEYDGRVERISGDEDSAWSTEDDEEKSDASMSDAPILIDLGNGFETSKTTPELEPETPPKMLNGSAAANFDATQQQSILGNITNGANSSTPAVSAEDSESPKPGPRDPDPIPRVSMEAFNLTSGPNAPPSFLVLDTIPVQHHYVGHARPSNSLSTRRIGKEYKILRNSLPPGIFVRTWESRLDLLRVLIIGPSDTPYEYAPFIIDMHLGCNFPSSPPEAFFHSWTDSQGPVNPNLYEDGKICLSLLGTWHADQRNENWNPAKSTVLQVLVSIMGLVLVKEPYYNEAGYEIHLNTPETSLPSALYTERAYFRARAFITHALTQNVIPFDEELKWLYQDQSADAPKLLDKAIDAAQAIIDRSEHKSKEDVQDGMKIISLGAVMMLKRQVKRLEGLRPSQDSGEQLVPL